MHWVNRGPEPAGLKSVRRQFTSPWVEHYRHGRGQKPSNAKWRDFLEDLRKPFSGLCAYCEERDKGEVEHFKPKSKFPELVYRWSNWGFSCHNCNQAKSDQWPPHGYIDPCARSSAVRPEAYFAFDTLTGEILPKEGLDPTQRNKAQRMIDDLKLNAMHHLGARRAWLKLIRGAFDAASDNVSTKTKFAEQVAARDSELSSVSRALLAQKGYNSFED